MLKFYLSWTQWFPHPEHHPGLKVLGVIVPGEDVALRHVPLGMLGIYQGECLVELVTSLVILEIIQVR